MKRRRWMTLLLCTVAPITIVAAPQVEATQRTEFQRFREYILSPEFLDVASSEAELMQTATGEITAQAKGYISAASSPGSFVWTVTKENVWTKMTSLGPIFTERGRTTSWYTEVPERGIGRIRGRLGFGLYRSYADFKEFDGNDINNLFKGPQVTTTTTQLLTPYEKVNRDLLKLDPAREWIDTFYAMVFDKKSYREATLLARQKGVPDFKDPRRELKDVKFGEGNVPIAYVLEETHEHLKQVAEATFGIKTQTWTALANFSATKRLDVTALFPIHSIDWESDVFREHYIDGVLKESSQAHFGDSATGLGDITLRSKLTLASADAPRASLTPHAKRKMAWPDGYIDCAAALDFRLPTGDEEEFLGTGSLGVTPFLMLSREFRGLRVTPYVNVGYLFDTEDSDWSRWEVKAALDFTPWARRFTVGGEFVGLLYDDFKIYDVGVSTKVAPFEGLAFAGSILFPVNDDGLRPDYVGVFGVEYSF